MAGCYGRMNDSMRNVPVRVIETRSRVNDLARSPTIQRKTNYTVRSKQHTTSSKHGSTFSQLRRKRLTFDHYIDIYYTRVWPGF